MTQDMNKNTILHLIVLLMMLMVGAGNVCGQTDVDYSGTYYIGSLGYKAETPTSNYYLCPTEGWCFYKPINDFSSDGTTYPNPFLTTFKCKSDSYDDATKAEWVVKKHPAEDYYYIIHRIDGKYLMFSGQIRTTSDANRIRVHLESTDSPDDNKALFAITPYKTYLVISPITEPEKWLVVNGGNTDYLTGQSGKTGGPTGYTNTKGVVGIYNVIGNETAPFYFEDIIPAPVITQRDNNTFAITYSGSGPFTLYYTTDGSSPDPENVGGTNPTKQYNSPISYQEGISVIKAVAVKAKSEGEVLDTYSRITSYNVIVLMGETHPYLVESQEEQSQPDVKYYMIPCKENDATDVVNKMSTTTLGQRSMMWYFKNAGTTAGVQYYYMVNKSTGQYVYYDANGIFVKSSGDFNDATDKSSYCFSINSAADGGYNICPFNAANLCLYKGTSNKHNSFITANKDKASVLGRWSLVSVPDKKMPDVAAPITISTNNQTIYYSIHNEIQADSYIVTPTSSSTFVTTATGTSVTDDGKWYFLQADKNDWLTYYYIVNAVSGEYLYLKYTGILNTNSADNVVFTQRFDGTDAERYQFVLAPSATGGYYIIPKSYAVENSRQYISLYRDKDNPLKLLRRRWSKDEAGSDDAYAKWTFTSAEAPANLPAPIITQDNGIVTITNMANAADVYYTTTTGDDQPLTDPSIPYEGPFTPGMGISTIWAIAVAKDNPEKKSLTSILSLPKLDSPTIVFDNVTNKITITSIDGATIYYTTADDNPTDPTTTTGTNGQSPIVINDVNSKIVVKAIAAKAGWKKSEITSLTIDKVAKPTTETVSGGKISITSATHGVAIYYVVCEPGDETTVPTTSSTRYTSPLEGVSGKVIKAIAVKSGWITSDVGGSNGVITLQCAKPVIRRGSGNTFTIECSFPATGVTIYYTTAEGETIPADPTASSSVYSDPVACTLPITIKAMAVATGYDNSQVAEKIIIENMEGAGTPDNPYLIASVGDFEKFIEKANDVDGASACYQVTDDFSVGTTDNIDKPFTGVFDGGLHTISGLGHALFTTVEGGTVKNVILDDVTISGTEWDNAGAICRDAIGDSRIYNCGVLDGSSVSGTQHVGGIVGFLDGTSRVINCYSYAEIKSGENVAGIVGYNNGTTNAGSITTMVMNCMFYGDITGGTTVSPVYGGNNINNLQGGLNTFNYYAYDKLKTKAISDDKYNCALAVEERYLTRFEFYRQLLNSNKKLAAIYASKDGVTVAPEDMAKWVLETADRTITDPMPYPVLKAQGRYPSIINIDAENATVETERNKGGLLNTLTVTISGVGDNAPSGAHLIDNLGNSTTQRELILNRTDKDEARFNFNYDKIQLPYYDEVGIGNYTGNRVVTGWKITAITAIDGDPYTSENYPTTGIRDYPDHNYADRKSSNKDLYTVSKRVFSQGAYFDVPYGVTSITIEPYWGNAIYVADQYYDVVYKNDYTGKQGVSQVGTQAVDNTTEFNGQKVRTSITGLSSGATVYDNAVVLVGNLHLDNVPSDGTTPFTMMSVDMDQDHEPDYSLIYHHKGRLNICPIRFDFLDVIGTAQAQKPNGASLICNFTICKTKGWFETTNTALIYSSQFEYENLGNKDGDNSGKVDAPLILLGGVFDQFVSTQSSVVNGKVYYIHVGGNVWINSFGLGTHSDGGQSTPHVPVSVTGGEFPGFYLTGTYNANAYERKDNAECYISGGYFHEAAGAAQEGINGNVRWQIYNADIDEFFGGGTNDAKPIKGDVTVDIYNSNVTLFCGGPKFGNMQSGKKVTTNAEGCTFGKFFGAGYGGLSYSRKKYYDKDDDPVDWSNKQSYYTNDRGKYFDGSTTNSRDGGTGNEQYGKKGPGVATDFDYEYFVWSSGATGGRFFVKFASFSLAQCNDVSSTLIDCTINGNFYGGGSLGKVTGTAMSVLDGCTVYGNVFGGGYSATLPQVPVRNAGFTKVPKFNKASGMFEPAELSDTTHFDWSDPPEGFTFTNGESGSDLGNKKIYAKDVDLKTLGQVANTVLTVKGNTFVQGVVVDGKDSGGVFGGGDESKTNGNTTVTIKDTGTRSVCNVFGGGNVADVGGTVTVNIEGGTVKNDVYGGGALANTNTANAAATPKTTTVNLKGGTINNNVYGGGLGRLAVEAKAAVGTEGDPDYIPGSPAVAAKEALVYGDVLVTLNGTQVFNNGVTTYPDKCVVKGSIFGCNNQNGSPQRAVTVHIHKTVGYEGHMGTPQDKLKSRDKNDHSYHLKAVYGGGDLAAYYPQEESVRDTAQTYVIIDGCGQTSIYQVYGGGNAASTPATNVTVNGTYEIEEVFGGGNGHDAITVNGEPTSNPGANVGFLDYSETENQTNVTAEELAAAKTNAKYGSGKACVNIYGGTIHAVFGGSNTKGNVREIAVAMLDMDGGCEFDVDEAYGGGKSADMDGEARLEMKCIPKMTTVYGGAMNADVYNNVKLNITNGTFEQVFGGNNMGGRIMGTITVNIEETGCKPIIIGELYGGGNRAPYSIYGYEDSGNTDLEFDKVVWLAKESKEEGGPEYGSPKVNVKSFTSIGDIYGGGYGETAVMVGDPEVNVNVVMGGHADAAYAGETKEIDGDIVTIPPHTQGEIGAIQNVFGGGNAAKVVGKPKVNIGTETSVTYETGDKAAHEVIGAKIVGNVYGGGNAAEVTGDTDVIIGKKKTE